MRMIVVPPSHLLDWGRAVLGCDCHPDGMIDVSSVNVVVRAVRNAQRARLGLPEVEHDGRDDIDAFIAAGGSIYNRLQ